MELLFCPQANGSIRVFELEFRNLPSMHNMIFGDKDDSRLAPTQRSISAFFPVLIINVFFGKSITKPCLLLLLLPRINILDGCHRAYLLSIQINSVACGITDIHLVYHLGLLPRKILVQYWDQYS